MSKNEIPEEGSFVSVEFQYDIIDDEGNCIDTDTCLLYGVIFFKGDHILGIRHARKMYGHCCEDINISDILYIEEI